MVAAREALYLNFLANVEDRNINTVIITEICINKPNASRWTDTPVVARLPAVEVGPKFHERYSTVGTGYEHRHGHP